MAMQNKAWMICFLLKKSFFFKRFVLSTMVLTNPHLLISDGHGSHVTLKAIEQA
jgi:hypothetical protein